MGALAEPAVVLAVSGIVPPAFDGAVAGRNPTHFTLPASSALTIATTRWRVAADRSAHARPMSSKSASAAAA